MLTLYYKETCPFCQRVMQMAENLGVNFDEMKDISDDEAFALELEEQGGKRQVPYLVDSKRNESMYESNDIIDYLREHYANTGAPAASKPRIHMAADATCVACEG